MRIHVDLTSHLVTGDPQIIQAEKTPDDLGLELTGIPINGKYLIPIPLGRDVYIENGTTYVLNGVGAVDGGDVTSIGFAHLLASFPQYDHIYFNPLLTADNLYDLRIDPQERVFVDRDLDPPVLYGPRFQYGRQPIDPNQGNAPNMTAILPSNKAVTPERPGLIITEELDIGPYTLDCDGNEVGADQFMVYWKIYGFETTHDIAADYGAEAGNNEPAVKYVYEVDQEPTDLTVYLSVDNGATWCPVGLLEPVAFCQKATKIMLAFRNDGNDRIYLSHFGVMF